MCLSDPNGESAKLVDYGSALYIEDCDKHCELQTLPYRCPEIALRADFGPEADLWSFGCLAYELTSSRVLFN